MSTALPLRRRGFIDRVAARADARAEWAGVRGVADARRGRIESAFVSAVERATSAISWEDVRAALQGGSRSHAHLAVGPGMAEFSAALEASLGPVLLGIVKTAGAEAAKQLPVLTTASSLRTARLLGVGFDNLNPEAAAWARARSSRLVVDISEKTREGLRVAIEKAFLNQQTIVDLARTIEGLKSAVGLDPRRLEILDSLRDRILANPGGKVWAGSTPIRVPAGGMPAALLQKRLDQYAKRLMRQRAMTIARTESVAAANEGQRQFWSQAQKDGLLGRPQPRRWITTPDDRLCLICAALGGDEAPDIDKPYPNGLMGPPAHPMCRCSQGLGNGKKSTTKSIAKTIAQVAARFSNFDPTSFKSREEVFNAAARALEVPAENIANGVRFGVDLDGEYRMPPGWARALYDPAKKQVMFGEYTSDQIEKLLAGAGRTSERWKGMSTLAHELGHSASPLNWVAGEYSSSRLATAMEEAAVEMRGRLIANRVVFGDMLSEKGVHLGSVYGSYADEVSFMSRVLRETKLDLEAVYTMTNAERLKVAGDAGREVFLRASKELESIYGEGWGARAVAELTDLRAAGTIWQDDAVDELIAGVQLARADVAAAKTEKAIFNATADLKDAQQALKKELLKKVPTAIPNGGAW